jgi:hypothetical protein
MLWIFGWIESNKEWWCNISFAMDMGASSSQGTCEYTSEQCLFIVHSQELVQEIQIRRPFLGTGEQSRRALISLGLALQGFLKKFLVASARIMAGYFSVDRATIKSNLDRELSLRKFIRRSMPISYWPDRNWEESRNLKVCWPSSQSL